MRTIQENLALLQSNKIAIKTSLQNKVGGGVISDDMSTYSEKIDETNNQLKGMLGMNQEFSIDLTGSGLTAIKQYLFYNAKITGITIPISVTSIENGAFYNCTSLAALILPSNLGAIGNSTFYQCTNLTSIIIPDSVTTIGNYTFQNCSGVTSITIGSGVISIGTAAFATRSTPTSITITATTPPTLANSNAFASTNDCPIYVPSDSVAAYKAASNWNSLSSRIQAIPEPD